MRYTSPPPSSNRTCGFPASGLPGFAHPEACTGRPAWPRGQVPARAGGGSSVVGLPQAVLPLSSKTENPVRALRSTGVTRLPRYYDPLRLLPRPKGGYVFPQSVAANTRVAAAAGTGLPGSSQVCRRPLSPTTPESPAAASARCLAVRYQASPVFEGWPLPAFRL